MTLALPLRTTLRRHEWFVAPTHIETAKRMVRDFHYAGGGSPNAVYVHGLFLRGDFQCYGVAWWIPATKGTVDKYNPSGFTTTLTLTRLVVHPLVPTNGASFLLGRSIRLIASEGRYDCLVTYADTWRGHTGAIYKATNWTYAGMTNPLPVWLDNSGRQRSTSNRLVYQGERRKSPTAAELRKMGYQCVGRYPKHVYTMRLKLKSQPVQLSLFDTA